MNELYQDLRPEILDDATISTHIQLGMRYKLSDREVLLKLVRALAKQKKELQDQLKTKADLSVAPPKMILKP